MVTQMAKYLDTVYVSGWQSSSTASASDEPGPDLADYPYVRQHSFILIQDSVLANIHLSRPLCPTKSAISLPPSCSMIENSAKSV
jgi:hypothetical protein